MNVEGQHFYLIRGYAGWPYDAVFVVTLLNDCLQRTCNANAITAHDRRLGFALCVQECSTERFAVFRAKLKDMSDAPRRVSPGAFRHNVGSCRHPLPL